MTSLQTKLLTYFRRLSKLKVWVRIATAFSINGIQIVSLSLEMKLSFVIKTLSGNVNTKNYFSINLYSKNWIFLNYKKIKK